MPEFAMYDMWDSSVVSFSGTWPNCFLGVVYEVGREDAKFGQTHNVVKITGFGSLEDMVNLASPEDAAEYFRSFSCFDLWFCMPIKEIEVYPDATEPAEGESPCWFRIPPAEWQASGLPEPSAKQVGGVYEVSRFVAVQGHATDKLWLHHVVEQISPSGTYKRVSNERVLPTPAFVEQVYLPSTF
jgi:hypothetical protein